MNRQTNKKIVHVVHAVDTEGPLYVDIDAKFETLSELLDIDGLEKSQETLDAILTRKIDLGEKQDIACRVMSSHRNNYMDSWEKLGGMLDHAMAPETRMQVPDSFGKGYVYNWFCLDHIGYEINPRRRELGFHRIFDYYAARIDAQEKDRGDTWDRDGLHWHFHPMSIYKEAHRCATSLLNSPHISETLARRIIERNWFPSSVRCGFQTERPDIHWFLEQYVPFDFTNTSIEDSTELDDMADLAHGRFGDWRRAPRGWGVYNPSHDDYQVPGNCRRYIARALNILSRFANLEDAEVDKAFRQADTGEPTLLAIATHDFRDLAPEAAALSEMLAAAAKRFPDVSFRYSEAVDAMRAVAHGGDAGEALKLGVELERDGDGTPVAARIDTLAGEVFGPQPFLAIETRGGRVLHDNLDFGTDGRTWRYTFDFETVPGNDLAAIGVGAADKFGNTAVDVVRNELSVSGSTR
ncbi:MAG: hypothetical protein ACFE0S_09940 [Rhodospirillales bacterium]